MTFSWKLQASTYAMALDPKGHVYITGFYEKQLQLGKFVLTAGSDGNGAFVARLDATGEVLWAREAYRPNSQGLSPGVAVGVDEAGQISLIPGVGGAMLTRWDGEGRVQWTLSPEPPAVQEGRMVVTAKGRIVLTGSFLSKIRLGAFELTGGGADRFVAAIDSQGKVLWARAGFGWGGFESHGRLAVDEADSVYFTRGTGTGMARLDKDGQLSWELKQVGGDAIALDPAQRPMLAGVHEEALDLGAGISLPAPGVKGKQLFVARFDPRGKALWAAAIGTTSQGTVAAMAVDGDGTIYLAGSFSRSLKLGQITLADTGFQSGVEGRACTASETCPDGYGCDRQQGDKGSCVYFGKDVFVAKLTQEGKVVWANVVSRQASDEVIGLVVDAQGRVYVAGSFGVEMYSPIDGTGPKCPQPQQTPSPEVCDGKDNDCDGKVDEDFVDKGKTCAVGVGACRREGKQVCTEDGKGLRCDATPGTPVAEVCDGIDNDCDGKVDRPTTLTRCVYTYAGHLGSCCETDTTGASGCCAEGAWGKFDFSYVGGLTVDADGKLLVIDGNRIRRIDSAGQIETVAGSTSGFKDGPGATAQFRSPRDLKVDADGNIYVADGGNHRVRKIDKSGNVTTVAGSDPIRNPDGTYTAGPFSEPAGLLLDNQGNIYVADRENHQIHKIDKSGKVTVIAGDGKQGYLDGPAGKAQFLMPTSLEFDQRGDLLIADFANRTIRKLDANGQVSSWAGSGPAGNFPIHPRALVKDADGTLYFLSQDQIFKLDATGRHTLVAGSGQDGLKNGPPLTAQFNELSGLALHKDILYIGDAMLIRMMKLR